MGFDMIGAWTYEVLPGLPAYGPLAEPFSPTGQGKHREGLVVRFTSETGESWAGNFQRDLGGIDRIVDHPNGSAIIVIAGGQGYIVDPTSRKCLGYLIKSLFVVAELNSIVLGNNLEFEAICATGFLWRSRRVSWDEMRNLSISDLTLTGEASDLGELWIPFAIDLVTGEVSGGSYTGPG
jgi:hypothetical protein